jgi:hypothetical protein
MKILTEMGIIKKTNEMNVIGETHSGYIGSVEVCVTVMKNGSMSIAIGKGVIALSPELTNDLKEILNPDSVSLAS